MNAYLLSFSHPTGCAKAEFFSRFGFLAEFWSVLADALVLHASSNEVAKADDTAFGMRYIVYGPLETPDGRRPRVRTVWFMEQGESGPRLVTAHPL